MRGESHPFAACAACPDLHLQRCHTQPLFHPLLPRSDDGAQPGGLGRGVSLRGDSRWLGLAKAAGQDVLAGLTQSRQLYVAEFAAS